MKRVTVSLAIVAFTCLASLPAWAQAAPHVAPTPVVAAAPQVAPVPPVSPAMPRPPRPPTGDLDAPQPVVGPQLPPVRPRGQLANVRIDVTVTDQTRSGAATTKTMTLTVADGESAMVRTETETKTSDGLRSAPFSVDVRAVIDGDKVRLDVGLDYQVLDAASTQTPGPPTRALFKGRQALVLENGKPLVISQSSDPMSDRKVTVEVKGTIIR